MILRNLKKFQPSKHSKILSECRLKRKREMDGVETGLSHSTDEEDKRKITGKISEIEEYEEKVMLEFQPVSIKEKERDMDSYETGLSHSYDEEDYEEDKRKFEEFENKMMMVSIIESEIEMASYKTGLSYSTEENEEVAKRKKLSKIKSVFGELAEKAAKRRKSSKTESRFAEIVELWAKYGAPLVSCFYDLKNLSRRNGESVSFYQKVYKCNFVFVCSYLSPEYDPSEHETLFPEAFLSTCLDLYSYRKDFELVLVTKTTPGDECAFNNVMATFPLSSIVVPFDEPQHLTFMCDLVLDTEVINDQVEVGFAYKCVFVNGLDKTVMVGKHNSMPCFVDHLKKLLKNSQFDNIDYHWVSETLWPLNSNWLSLTPPFYPPVSRIFENVKPEYSDDINDWFSGLLPIQIGQKLDVKSLLLASGSTELVRNHGEQVELGKAIEGKHTMICCFHAPVFGTEWNSVIVQSLVNTCSELYTRGVNFEMVVVVKMKKRADYKLFFDRFLSGFPRSCFVIPFEDSKLRDIICNYLKLSDDDVRCLLLDDDNNVLLHGYPTFAWRYGADAFPFTDEKLRTLKEERLVWTTRSCTNDLVSLLRCKPSDVLKKTAEDEGGCDYQMELTMSGLIKNDVVGVYLCANGDLIRELKKVYEQCKIQQKPFEILLVYIPFNTCLDPQNYKVCVDKMLQEHNLSLWYMPFDNSVSHKLTRRISGSLMDDQLIMFRGGQGGQGAASSSSCIDMCGAHMIRQCGIDAYPFNRKELVARELNRLRELTLETLLVYKTRTFVLKNNREIPVADLKDMNVLVWIGSLSYESDLRFFEKLYLWYRHTKNKIPDEFEVVLVLHDLPEEDESDISAHLPWMVCPFDAEHSAFVLKELFFNDFVEFGKDGRVRSLRSKHLVNIDVDDCGTIPFGSKGDLRRDAIVSYFDRYNLSMVM